MEAMRIHLLVPVIGECASRLPGLAVFTCTTTPSCGSADGGKTEYDYTQGIVKKGEA